MNDSTPSSNAPSSGFLNDHTGQPSSMRLLSFVSLLMSFAFGLIAALHPRANDVDALYLSVAFLVGAFAPKALQKFAESKFPIERKEEKS